MNNLAILFPLSNNRDENPHLPGAVNKFSQNTGRALAPGSIPDYHLQAIA
jgi:hypothetical protein